LANSKGKSGPVSSARDWHEPVSVIDPAPPPGIGMNPCRWSTPPRRPGLTRARIRR